MHLTTSTIVAATLFLLSQAQDNPNDGNFDSLIRRSHEDVEIYFRDIFPGLNERSLADDNDLELYARAAPVKPAVVKAQPKPDGNAKPGKTSTPAAGVKDAKPPSGNKQAGRSGVNVKAKAPGMKSSSSKSFPHSMSSRRKLASKMGGAEGGRFWKGKSGNRYFTNADGQRYKFHDKNGKLSATRQVKRPSATKTQSSTGRQSRASDMGGSSGSGGKSDMMTKPVAGGISSAGSMQTGGDSAMDE